MDTKRNFIDMATCLCYNNLDLYLVLSVKKQQKEE